MKGMTKMHKVMSEFKRGTLHSGSGGNVSSRRQAIAIGLSEARKAGAKLPMAHKTILSPFGNISHPAPAVSWSAKNGGKFGNEL